MWRDQSKSFIQFILNLSCRKLLLYCCLPSAICHRRDRDCIMSMLRLSTNKRIGIKGAYYLMAGLTLYWFILFLSTKSNGNWNTSTTSFYYFGGNKSISSQKDQTFRKLLDNNNGDGDRSSTQLGGRRILSRNHRELWKSMDVARAHPIEWMKVIVDWGSARFHSVLGDTWKFRNAENPGSEKGTNNKKEASNQNSTYMRTKKKTQKSVSTSTTATKTSFQIMTTTTIAPGSLPNVFNRKGAGQKGAQQKNGEKGASTMMMMMNNNFGKQKKNINNKGTGMRAKGVPAPQPGLPPKANNKMKNMGKMAKSSLQITILPTTQSSQSPSISIRPSQRPSASFMPSNSPSELPTLQPSTSGKPSAISSKQPSHTPSRFPSLIPTTVPSKTLSRAPFSPSIPPSNMPSQIPSGIPLVPSTQSSQNPSRIPSIPPSISPSKLPSVQPNLKASSEPSWIPSIVPSRPPSQIPSISPSTFPSAVPSVTPSKIPTSQPVPV